MGFKYNSYWKERQTMVEEIMGVSKVTYRRVKVIGEKSSSATVQFEGHDDKQEFRRWLGTYADEVRKGRGVGSERM